MNPRTSYSSRGYLIFNDFWIVGFGSRGERMGTAVILVKFIVLSNPPSQTMNLVIDASHDVKILYNNALVPVGKIGFNFTDQSVQLFTDGILPG